MFGGSCIGVIALVISLEFLRRLQREYARRVAHSLRPSLVKHVRSIERSKDSPDTASEDAKNESSLSSKDLPLRVPSPLASRTVGQRISMIQQAIRAALYTAQFAVAYILMLLAMYYNGYIIICIFIGAFIGHFALSWDLTRSEDTSVIHYDDQVG